MFRNPPIYLASSNVDGIDWPIHCHDQNPQIPINKGIELLWTHELSVLLLQTRLTASVEDPIIFPSWLMNPMRAHDAEVPWHHDTHQ